MAKRQTNPLKVRTFGSLQILLRSIWSSALTLSTKRNNTISPQRKRKLNNERLNKEHVYGQCGHRKQLRR